MGAGRRRLAEEFGDQLGAPGAADVVKGADLAALIAKDDQGRTANVDGLHVPGFGQFCRRTGKDPGPAKTVLLLQRQPLVRPIGGIRQAACFLDRRKGLGKAFLAQKRFHLLQNGGVGKSRVHVVPIQVCACGVRKIMRMNFS